jgi:hypothetical protein
MLDVPTADPLTKNVATLSLSASRSCASTEKLVRPTADPLHLFID